MLEKSSRDWERLLFRDYLIEHPYVAKQYETLKYDIAGKYADDRKAYAKAKSEFIDAITRKARQLYGSDGA